MAPPVTPGRRLAPSGLGRARGHLAPAALRSTGERTPARRRDLVIVGTTVVAMAAVVNGPAVWLAAALLLGAMVVGTLQLLGEVDGPTADRGVPVESLILPSLAAIGCLGAIRLVPLGLAIVPALFLTAVLIDRAVTIEARIATAAQSPSDEDRSATLQVMLLIAIVAFAGVAAIVPGGIVGFEPAGAPVPPLAVGNLVELAVADAFIAGLLGYRAAALRVAAAREALWAGLTYAVAIAIGAAAIRAMGIPRLVGPALLMFLLYLWDTLHAAPPARRRSPRWIWETIVLVGLGAVVAFWNLHLDT